MCRPGDIILIEHYYSNDGHEIGRHSFIVLEDEGGQIKGLDYDLICNVMSSFKNKEQREKKLKYPGNFEIKNMDTQVKNGNKKDGYIKAEQFFYFNKAKTEFVVIGFVVKEVFEQLLEFVANLEAPIIEITDNL
jgi:hypothetical protein